MQQGVLSHCIIDTDRQCNVMSQQAKIFSIFSPVADLQRYSPSEIKLMRWSVISDRSLHNIHKHTTRLGPSGFQDLFYEHEGISNGVMNYRWMFLVNANCWGNIRRSPICSLMCSGIMQHPPRTLGNKLVRLLASQHPAGRETAGRGKKEQTENHLAPGPWGNWPDSRAMPR